MTMLPTVYMPATGTPPAVPLPYVLTEDEAANIARETCEDPQGAIRRCREAGLLKAVEIDGQVRYLLPDVWKLFGTYRPAEPAPYVLTERDVARLLRIEPDKAGQALGRYRRNGQLTPIDHRGGRRYSLSDVLAFLEKAKEENPR